jgi:hypothetical protein
MTYPAIRILSSLKEDFMRRKTRIGFGLSALLGMLAVTAVAMAATVVVSPGHLAGWTAVHESCNAAASTGSIGFVSGPGSPPSGDGSVRFTTGPNGDSYETLRQNGYNGVKLSDLTQLDYWTYVSQNVTSQAVYIDLYVDNTGDGVKDDTLTFEPTYNGTVTLNTWQHWNALTGSWWADSSGGPPPLFTLASYVASHPNARIVNDGPGGVLLSAGCGGGAWVNFVGNADLFTIGVNGSNTSYDFEPTPAAPPPPAAHKVTICHKGHTITVDKHAVPAHLKHGDHTGHC